MIFNCAFFLLLLTSPDNSPGGFLPVGEMAENRNDSAVEEDLWTEDDRDIIEDDVFEMLSKAHDQDGDEPSSRSIQPPLGQMRLRDGAPQEDGAPGSASVKPRPAYSLWSVYGRQYALQGNTNSIITRLHPTFCLDSPPAPPPPTRPPLTPPTTPTEPPNSSTPTTEPLAEMVTLHSLGCSRDSGYVPSPCSTHSFTYSSDEDEPKDTPTPRPGVTPPIAIPNARHRPSHHPPTSEQHHQDKTTPKSTEEEEEKRTPPSTYRCRTRSCPDQVRPPALPRTPVPRFPSTLTPAHRRNWSTPATTPDGQPLLTPSPLEARANTPRASRDALIDLSEEDGGASGGHRRRVLVLALPDVVIDTEGRATGACTPPSAEAPDGHPESRDSFEMNSSGLRGTRPRPAWQRHRALSCDVTLEEELGQELRRIADGFQREIEREEDASVWRLLRGGFRRSFNSLLSFSQRRE